MSENLPAAALSNFSYDAESNVTTYDRNVYGVSNGNVGTFVYSSRGELVTDPRSSMGAAYFAYNVQVSGTSSGKVDSWDARAGVLTANGSPYVDPNGNSNGISFSYDNAGRQTGSDESESDRLGNAYDVTNNRQYDTEGRIISGTQVVPYGTGGVNYNATMTGYQWGPDGHVIRMGSTPKTTNAMPTNAQLSYDTLHWDGENLLFTSNAQGQVDDIKVQLPDGGTADITPLDPTFSGLTYWDRVLGNVSFCHNASGSAGADKVGSSFACTASSGQTIQLQSTLITTGASNLAGGVGQGKVLGSATEQQYSDGVNEIQDYVAFDALQNGAATSEKLNILNTGNCQGLYGDTGACVGGTKPPVAADGGVPIHPWIPSVLYEFGFLPSDTWKFGVHFEFKIYAGDGYFGSAFGNALPDLLGVAAGLLTRDLPGALAAAASILSGLDHLDIKPGFYVTDWHYDPHGDGATMMEKFNYKDVNNVGNFTGYANYNVTTQDTTVVVFSRDANGHTVGHTFAVTPAGSGYEGESASQVDAAAGAYSESNYDSEQSFTQLGTARNAPL